jgi:hypothetical protein
LKLKSKDKLEQVLNNLKKIESNSTSHGVSDGSETDSDSELDQNDCLFDSQNKSIKLNNWKNNFIYLFLALWTRSYPFIFESPLKVSPIKWQNFPFKLISSLKFSSTI